MAEPRVIRAINAYEVLTRSVCESRQYKLYASLPSACQNSAQSNEISAALMVSLHDACRDGDTERVRQLLDEGAPVDEKDEYPGQKDDYDRKALGLAIMQGHAEVVGLLLSKGAAVEVKDKLGDTALLALVAFDEEQLGRMAAAQVHHQIAIDSKARGVEGSEKRVATAKAVLQLVNLAGFARERALKLRSSDPHSADDHQVLFGRLQLAAAACVQNDESGKARDDPAKPREENVHKLFRSNNGRKALEHAVQVEAKELLAQPVVQDYMMVAWRGGLVNLGGRAWVLLLALLVLLLQLLVVLPLVALVPPLDRLLLRDLAEERWIDTWWRRRTPLLRKLLGRLGYLLQLPVVKFGLEFASDLALALALTLVPATDLATAPVAPLLLAWVGSGLLWEAGQVMAPSSSDAASRLARAYDRLAAYWADGINRLDATALIFSFAALIASLSSTEDNGDATATSLRVVAVFLLWFRLLRVLLVSPRFGPYVMMFFRMASGDLVSFLVLLVFLLLAFAASWTVLLEPEPALLAQQFGDDQNWRWTRSHAPHLETAGCADELGGLDIVSRWQTLVEGALTGNDFFECARDSTKSPEAAWALSLVFVALTSVLLLNMLIAMCATILGTHPAQSPRFLVASVCEVTLRPYLVPTQDGQDL